MRRYYRHPADIPVDLVPRIGAKIPQQRLHNISLGGLACKSNRAFECGTQIEVRIPLLGIGFSRDQVSCSGLIAWCEAQGEVFLVGVTFTDENTPFRLRMIEQICQIEHCRREREQLVGRKVAVEEVAEEWINHYAGSYSRQGVK